MSTVSSTNEVPGDVTNAVSVNTKFANVATASGAINEENVRSEGVDRRNMAPYAVSIGRQEPIVIVEYDDNTTAGAITPFTYAAKDGTAAFQVNHDGDLLIDFTGLAAGFLPVAVGDLIRIHFTIFFSSHPYASYTSAGQAVVATQDNPADAIGLLFFPAWDIGAGFEVLTGEENLLASFGPGAGVVIDNNLSKTDAVAWVSLEGVSIAGASEPRRMVHGSWSHIATGTKNIRQIRLYCRGPMVYQGNPAGDRYLWVPTWNAGRYAAAYMDIPGGPNPHFDITLANGQLGITVMRGDS